MPVYLPIAEMSVHAGGIILLGVIVGFFSGMFGVGGGFMATPLLMFIGVPPAVAVATQTCQIVASSSAGVISQWPRKGIDLQMAMHMLAGGLCGTVIGFGIFHLLRAFGQIGLAISILYTLLLGSIGIFMLIEIALSFFARNRIKSLKDDNRVLRWLKELPYQTKYEVSGIHISCFGPMGIGFISGTLVAVLGTGAGFLMVPAMIYFLGMPALLVTGTSLFQLLFLASLSCVVHALTTHSIDLMLAMLLIAGSVVGTVLGLRATKYIKGIPARLMLAVVILLVAARMGYGLLIPPESPFVMVMEP